MSGSACNALVVVVEADTIVVFKWLLDRHMDGQGMEEYGSCAGG